MALPADFNKIYGSTATGGLTPISDVNYAKGWEFIGANPPTKNDFSYLQNLSDLKSQWLYNNKLQRSDPFGDIKSAGTVQTALANLGLGDGSALPVGIPVPWPASTAPTGWLKCNGAPFSADQYPKLALVYPSLLLPDLRGEFIRGWDDERGVDTGRALLSSQLDSVQNGTGSVQFRAASSGNSGVLQVASGAFVRHANTGINANTVSPVGGVNASCDEMSFDLSRVIRTSTETRPRNIAFNYIVRAA